MNKRIRNLDVRAMERIEKVLPIGWLAFYYNEADNKILEFSYQTSLHAVGDDIYIIFKDGVAKITRNEFSEIELF